MTTNVNDTLPETSHRLDLGAGLSMFYRRWHARDNPQRRVLVLLHGMASNHTRWSEFLEHTNLKEHWDILRPDLRGHGESFTRSPVGARRWCADLLALLDQEGCERAVFVGHSLGAQVAVQFAARHIDRTRGMVLIDPVFNGTLRGSALWIRRFTPLLYLLIGLVRLFNVLGLHRRHIPNRDLRELDERTRARLLNIGKQEEMIKLYSSPWLDLRFFPTANYLQEFIEVTRPVPSLRDIPAPTLVLLSQGVTFTDPAETRRRITGLTHVETGDIPAYHWPLTERPREVREAIEHWCASLLRTSR
jgi:pimeloyl-ACP methyl ester carboxylesterase